MRGPVQAAGRPARQPFGRVRAAQQAPFSRLVRRALSRAYGARAGKTTIDL